MGNIAKSQCPVCHSDRIEKYRPFCSKRCAELDLGRWFSGNYAIATEERPDEDDFEMPDGHFDDESF